MKLLVYAFPCQSLQIRVVEDYNPTGDSSNCKEVYCTSFNAISSFASETENVRTKFSNIDEAIIFGPYEYATKFKDFVLETFGDIKARIVSPRKGF